MEKVVEEAVGEEKEEQVLKSSSEQLQTMRKVLSKRKKRELVSLAEDLGVQGWESLATEDRMGLLGVFDAYIKNSVAESDDDGTAFLDQLCEAFDRMHAGKSRTGKPFSRDGSVRTRGDVAVEQKVEMEDHRGGQSMTDAYRRECKL